MAFDPPIRYLRRPSGEIVLDPDEQVQQVVRLIFRKFQEIGTLNGLLRYLYDSRSRWAFACGLAATGEI